MILSIVLGLLSGCLRVWKLVIGWLGVRWALIPCALLVPSTGELFILLSLYFISMLAFWRERGGEERNVIEQELISDSKGPQSHGLQAASPPTH